MRRLLLDYQRPEPGRRRAGALLLAAGLIATAVLLADYFTVMAELDDLQHRVARLKRDVERQRLAEAAGSPLSGAQAATAHSAASWEALFASLEAAGDDSVTLLGLEPGATEIRITAEAKNLDASLDYLKRLQAATAIANTRLTQSQVVMEHPRRPVRFTLVTEWRGA